MNRSYSQMKIAAMGYGVMAFSLISAQAGMTVITLTDVAEAR